MSEHTFAAARADAPGLEVRNDSKLGAMLWIGLYTFLLNIVTLTIFRFWGRTHFRRRLWADTQVGSEPLEYTGRGMELFIGFVIAIFTLMVPFIGALLIAQTLLRPGMLAAVVAAIYLVLFIIIGVAIFLARRYHLSRTRLRGIRFAQTGSAIDYGLANFGYILLTAITLGWFGPAARIRLSRKLWEKAYFGSLPFAFVDTPEAKAEPVYKSFAVAWVIGVGAYIVWAMWLMSRIGGGVIEAAAPDIEFVISMYLSLIPLGLIIGLAVAWHEAVMIRRIIKSLRLGNAQFSSDMRTLDVIELAITNTLLIIFTFGIGLMAAQMRLWKRIANRMSLQGAIDFDAVKQSEADAPKQGEGLADGLDLVSNF